MATSVKSKCPFLVECEERKLFTILCNNLSLGQFEPGRAALHQLFHLNRCWALAILQTLLHRGPPDSWLRSASIPSVAHFTWLCVTEYMVLAPGPSINADDALSDSLTSRLVFELLLACIQYADQEFDIDVPVSPPFTDEVLADIRRFRLALLPLQELVPHADEALWKRHNGASGNDASDLLFSGHTAVEPPEMVDLSTESLNQVKVVFQKYPLFGHALCEQLSSHSPLHIRTTERLQGLYIDLVSDLLSSERYEEACCFLCFLNVTPDMSEAPMHRLFSNLVALCQDLYVRSTCLDAPPVPATGSVLHESQDSDVLPDEVLSLPGDLIGSEGGYEEAGCTLPKFNVYQALLSSDNGYPLAQYCEMEDHDVRQQSQNARLPAPYRALFQHPTASSHDLEDFWRGFFGYLRVTKGHCLEYVLGKSLDFIKKRTFDDTSRLLVPFAPLKPLLVMLSWDYFRGDITSQQRVMDTLWGWPKPPCADPQIEHMCKQLEYQLSIAWWYAKKYISAKALPTETDLTTEVANEVLEALMFHSSLYVMRVRLPFLDPKETLQIVQARPADTEKIMVEKELDLVILRGYYALKQVAQLFYDQVHSQVSDDTILAVLEDTQQHILAVAALQNRVELLENLFCLLFLKRSQLKNRPVEESFDPFDRMLSPLDYCNGGVDIILSLLSSVPVLPKDLFCLFPPALLGHRLWRRSPFITTAPLTRAVMTLIKACIADTKNALFHCTESLAANSLLPFSRTRVLAHVDRLERYVQEADYRLEILTSLAAECRLKNAEFMPRMLASPDTLLSLCLKKNDYARCKDIIRFFHLSHSRSATVLLAEQLDQINIALDGCNSHIKLDPVLSASSLQAFYICSDLAVAMARMPPHCAKMLDLASQYLARSTPPTAPPDSNSFFPVSTPSPSVFDRATGDFASPYSFPCFGNLLRRLRHLTQGFPSQPLRALLASVETFPTDATTLQAHLTQRQAKLSALTSLIQTLEKLKEGDSDSSRLEGFLASLIATFACCQVDTTGRVVEADKHLFLSRFLDYVLQMGNTLRSSNAEREHNFSYLEEGPKRILARLVYEGKFYERAKNLAALMDIDLMGVILRSCRASGRGHIITGKRIEGVRDDDSGPRTAGAGTTRLLSFPLTMDVVRFMELYVPRLASVACLTRSPPGVLNGEFLDYAMSHTQSYPTLHRWVCLRALPYAHLISVILPSRHDEAIVEEECAAAPPCETVTKRFFMGQRSNAPLPASVSFYSPTSPHVEESFTTNFASCPGDVDLDEDELECLNIVNMENGGRDEEFYQRVIDKLVHSGDVLQAYSLADAVLPTGAPDSLLVLLVEKTEDKSIVWQYIRRIRDARVAARLVQKWVNWWDVEIGIDLLFMCQSHLSSGDETKASVEGLWVRMQSFRDILHVDSRWKRWQDIAETCQDNPEVVIRSLVEIQQYELARRVMEQWKIPHMKLEIEESYMMDLLTKTHEIGKGLEVLVSLGEEALPLCDSLQQLLSHDYPNKLFLVQFLLNKMRASQTPENFRVLAVREVGLQVMIRLPTNIQHRFHDLVDDPSLMVENLLMAQHTFLVARLFRELPELQDDELVIRYAEKALTFPESLSPNGREPTRLQSPELVVEKPEKNREDADQFGTPDHHGDIPFLTFAEDDWWLTGDREQDARVRQEHFFRQAPNFNLTRAFLDLCADPLKAGHACLKLCDSLSQFLLSVYHESHFVVVSLIEDLLSYAKCQFANDTNSNGRLALCDLFLSHVELLQAILSVYCRYTIPISDLSDPRKAEQLRDKLIDDDYMRLAGDVCIKCGVDDAPVWSAWGMALLQVGLYEPAKEKFRHCLVVASKGDYSSSPPCSDTKGIIAVLEACPPTDYVHLKNMHEEMIHRQPMVGSDDVNFPIDSYTNDLDSRGSLAQRIAPLAERLRPQSNVDAVRYEQCLFYLKTYGTAREVVAFYTRHGQLEEACRFVFNHHIPVHIFVETIVTTSLQTAVLDQLREILQKIDPTMQSTREHILGICKFLAERKAFHLLYEFQVLMKDDIRAGMTCLNLFANSTDFDSRIEHLNKVKNHFLEGLIHYQEFRDSNNPPVMSEADIAKHLKMVKLQIEVTTFFGSCARPMSLFGSNRKEIAELILPDNFDLGVRLIHDLYLPCTKIFVNVVTRLAHERKMNQVNELLLQIKSVIASDQEWDQVVMACIDVYAKEHQDFKSAEKFISKLVSDRNKVRACISCQKFKSALRIATDARSVEDVQLVRICALRINSRELVVRCDKFLAQQGEGK